MENISLFDANKNRACLIAEAISQRVHIQNNWSGYTRAEGMDGILQTDTLIKYNRPGHRGGVGFAMIAFENPVVTEIQDIDWGDPVIVESNVQERIKQTITNSKPVSFDEEVSHTFSKTTNMNQSFKLAAELAIKTSFEGGAEGFKAGAEVSAKLSAEYNRAWGESVTQTDTVTQTLHFPANTDVTYEAVRSIDKEQRNVTGKCNFDHSIQFVSAPGEPPLVYYRWESVEEFISVARGFASAQHPGYELFINNRLSDDEVEAIKAPSGKEVSFLMEYDNIQSQKITIV